MELNEALLSMAENLREERIRAGLTLEQLAQRAELSAPHLSRLESGERQPSIAALLALSRALGVPMARLLGERGGAPAIAVYEPGAPAAESEGMAMTAIGGFPGSVALEVLSVRISPDRVPPEPARHRGEEWIYVLAGRLVLEFDGHVHVIGPGASVHFDAERPHRLAADGGTPVEILLVAADSPGDLRAHPLFRTSIADH
jgi:transcriptional regulator with XRE-family HTH domain